MAILKSVGGLSTSPSTTTLYTRLGDRTWWYCTESVFMALNLPYSENLLVILNEIASFASEMISLWRFVPTNFRLFHNTAKKKNKYDGTMFAMETQ